ncbi:amino acid adenylation [Pusillimonas sp. T7-7]|uniref:non-ribosomal peptide synthetase n=1 Tax=Pusillimonas sp. (strain T7-7) TaxID=1007105 RepID=UPI0002085331|nr:non-ribosomal peptide synthetase [Pusillimonas sp. T7-7]AEC21905.1 amino acid adenylation [Pusillimonas sp. T7-7]
MSSGYIAAASFAQRQLRYLDLLQPGRSDYALPLLIEISPPVDEASLRLAFNAVIQRHDVLRASFPLIDDVPAQTVHDDLDIPLPRIDMPGDRDQWLQGIRNTLSDLASQGLNLDQGPVVVARLFVPDNPLAAGCGMALGVVFHHAVADGASLPLFIDDLAVAYDAVLSGTAPAWAELPLQYPDYADWEQEQFGAPHAPALTEALRYWREQLHEAPALLDLPVDGQRGARPSGPGATQRLLLPGAIGTALAESARQRGSTPFMALLAVFFAVLHRWSGLEDLMVTVPVSKRTRPELAGLIGLLVDTLPLRIQCDADTRYDTLLEQVQRTFRDAVRHRDVPFQRIVQAIDIERHADVIPLMQILFGGLEADGRPVQTSDGSRYTVVDDQTEQAAKSDLSVVYRQTDQHLELWCRYDPSLFERATIGNLLSWFGALAEAAAAAPSRALADLPLISDAQGRDLVRRFNDTRRPYASELSVVAMFDSIAQRCPNNPAIEENGTTISYAELLSASARMASALGAVGVGAGDPVVIVQPPCARYVTLVLAVLRLGAIYVPLDPAHPHAHRCRLAKSIGARAILLAADTDEQDYEGIDTHDIASLEDRASRLDAFPAYPLASSSTAYIMFTSGSTGEPKGVAVPHRGIVRLAHNVNFAEFGPQTRAALYSNPAFDASTLEIWSPLLNGGALVTLTRTTVLDSTLLKRTLDEHNITLMWITTGLFHEIAAIDPSLFAGQRTILTGGDTTNLDLARAVYQAGVNAGLQLLHAYGPTENTTFSTCFNLADLRDDDIHLPLGPPVANSTVYVLDRRGKPLPPGINGELYVGGDGVASGYVNDPERSAAAFLPDPFDDRDGARMYRTGDFGRWRPDGLLLFTGRSDDQVKVRGFRIELNEIAAALARHPALRMVHVAAPRQGKGERQIIAYAVPQTMPGPSPADLRQFLQALLPPHMLPHAYVSAKTLALNLNGKVDRKALPPVEDHHYDRAGGLVAPRNEEEILLQSIWQELLGLESVGVTESFFHIGGDSILAIRMAARASEAGYSLTPSDVFQLQTIEQLAGLLISSQSASRRSAARIFPAELLPEATGAVLTQPYLLASVVLDQSVRAVELALTVQRLAERHDALRLRWMREGQSSHLEIAAYVGQLPIRMVEAANLPDTHIDEWVAEHAERLGRGLDTQTGVTLAATLVDRGAAMPPVVVLAVHPGAADQASLALLLSELNRAIKSGTAALPLPNDGLNYGDWLSWLQEHADRQAAGPGLAALEAPALRDAALPRLDGRTASLPVAARLSLPSALSDTLCRQTVMQLAITPLDMLAAALSCALDAGEGLVLLEALDTPRHLPDDAPDAHRIMGKMDSVLPILAPTGHMPALERLQAVKSARQAVSATACAYKTLVQAFDLPTAKLGLAWAGTPITQHHIRMHSPPSFSSSVQAALLAELSGGQLKLAWAGAESAIDAAALLERVAAALQAIAELAVPGRRPLYTDHDFPLAQVSGPTLTALLSSTDHIQDIYPLSPMQEAMLVHSLAASGSGVNFEQSCMRIVGKLDLEAFRHAWATVFERHDVLRTAFHWRGLARPLQVVQHQVPLPLTIEHWPQFDAARLQVLLAQDQARGFQLEQAPLVRLTLIQVADDDVYLISSFHHLLVDGWCLGRLEREVRAAYESYRSRRTPLLDPIVPYRSYIAWLERNDHADSKAFFARQLQDLPERRCLFAPASRAAHRFNTQRLALSKPASRALTAFARRRGLTLATVMHYVWAAWLAARLDTRDVVFGTTVSGRPAGIPGVEHIVGMFINNLPVRARLDPDGTPASQLAALQTQLGQLQQHAHLSPADIAATASASMASGPLFDTLVLVENLASGTSAWSGAEGLQVEAVHTRLKTAYDLTFVAIPGESIALSVVQPDDGRELEEGEQLLRVIAAMLAALPTAADGRHDALPRPEARTAPMTAASAAGSSLRFATRPRSTLEARIAGAVSSVLPGTAGPGDAGDNPDLDTDFWLLGLNSLRLTQLALRLEQVLDRSVPISLLLEHRSVAALAQALESGQRWSPVVPMNQTAGTDSACQANPPFVCVHPVAGDVSVFLDLARALPPSLPFWAIQAAGLEQGQQVLRTIPEMARANLQALAKRGQASPRWVGGYSFGGLVAFEMARQLAALGSPPERVVLIDTPAPLERTSILDPDPERAQAQWLARMADVRARFQGIEPVLTQEELLTVPASSRFEFAAQRLHGAKLLPPAADAHWLERALDTGMAQYEAYLAYRPAANADTALCLALIRASAPRDSDLGKHENQLLALPDMGWQTYSTSVEIRHVAGDHVTMLSGASVGKVANAIADVLQAPSENQHYVA